VTQTFLKTAETPNLESAEHKKIIKGIYAENIFHLLGHKDLNKPDTVAIDTLAPDSLRPRVKRKANDSHKLTLRLITAIDGTYQRFRDKGINTSRIAASFVTPYPTLDLDTTDLDESYATTTYRIAGAGSYSFDKKAFYANLSAGIGYRAVRYRKLTETMTDGRTEQWARARLDVSGINLTLQGEARLESSTLFEAETHTTAGMSFRPRLGTPVFEITDTLTVGPGGISQKPGPMVPGAVPRDSILFTLKSLYPLALDAHIGLHNQNPSYFQQYFQASPGNTYLPNSDLKNMQLLHARGGFTFEGGKPVLTGDTLQSNMIGVEAFYSRAARFVYYSPEFDVLQADAGEGLTWIGLEFQARYRFFRKMYVEGQVTLQQGSTAATGDLERYTRHIPQVYGKASLYYDNRNLSFAGMLRVGADVSFFTAYESQTVDVLSGEFFPTNYTVQPYPRVDLYFSTQVKRAFLFVKLIHINELLINTGYYTTPFYPELERTFTFGVNWTFFD
ncbi:putative porin, partial [bacterium]|nr:putative porin [bacterium]